VPNATEQEAIGLMHKLRANGESLRAIGTELNRLGYRTKEGRPWLFTSVKGILARAA